MQELNLKEREAESQWGKKLDTPTYILLVKTINWMLTNEWKRGSKSSVQDYNREATKVLKV